MVTGDERVRLMKEQGTNFIGATDLIPRLYGDTALITGIATTKTPAGDSEQSRFMQVWVMQGENLRLVATQATKIAMKE